MSAFTAVGVSASETMPAGLYEVVTQSWRVGERLIVGTLNVKLGGKNMTFFQRVTAKPLAPCPSRPR